MKYDGFRAVAYIEDGLCRLVSRNGHTFKSFAHLAGGIAGRLGASELVLDGEIVCLDKCGRPQFKQLLFRREQPFFAAFDLLYRDGIDLRLRPLHERKAALEEVVRNSHCHEMLYVDHVEVRGTELFHLVCAEDLEGVVAKHKFSPYLNAHDPWWLKIRNRRYTQWDGREELFERERHREPVAGWHSCTLVVENALIHA
jgi:bifunctional non-homologous end joining protein LigD